MPYDIKLADRIREYLADFPTLNIEEKKMFQGLAFMVNGKMCVNVSGDNLICRFDPALHGALTERKGFQKMIMRGKELKGHCYVSPDGFKAKKDFEYWFNLCLNFNDKAKSSTKYKQ